jgi:hypothetical protein
VRKIDLFPLLGADEVGGDVMVASQYHMFVAVVQTSCQFSFNFIRDLGMGFFLFLFNMLLDLKSL